MTINEFLSKPIFRVDGLTLTLGVAIVLVILAWFMWFRK